MGFINRPFSSFLSVLVSLSLVMGLIPSLSFAVVGEAFANGEGDVAPASYSDSSDDSSLRFVVENGFENFGIDSGSSFVSAVTDDGATATSAVAEIYQLVCDGYDNLSEQIDLSERDFTVGDFREAQTLITANPEYYWAASAWGISFYDSDADQAADDDERLGGIYLYYCVDTSDIETVKSTTEAKIAEALSWVDADSMSQLQAVQALHDYLVRNCAYDTSLEEGALPYDTTSYSAYGALTARSCVCQGYALAYKLLLSRLGVSCVFVQSTEMNHAWNMVLMDDDGWYHVDTTWDDPIPDGGFDGDVCHDYFLRSDSSMKSMNHSSWEAAYASPASDYSDRTYGVYSGPFPSDGGSEADLNAGSESGSGGSRSVVDPESGQSDGQSGESSSTAAVYAHSAYAEQNGVTFTVKWNDPTAGSDTVFHVSATNGSSNAKARMDVPTYTDTDASKESVCDPSRSTWSGASSYKTLGEDGYDFTFSFTASGSYSMYFYFMDVDNSVTYLRAEVGVTIDDVNYPAVSAIVSDAVTQAQRETDGGDYAMALWLHDWELQQLDYDYSLNFCSAESGLTRGKGTCESFQRIYQKLLTCAGIENARMEGNGHTWNAVKIDDKWCQVDVNWDDVDYSSSYGFDSTHLYFGLTDELMAKAHSDHATTYQESDYGCRSIDLSNNYFVRSGQADIWASAYAERVQKHLDAKETEFSIDSDNASNPPSICSIQNGIVADALSRMDWTASDGSAASVVAISEVATESSTSWTARYVFTASYESAADIAPTPDSGADSGSDSSDGSGSGSDDDMGFDSDSGADSGAGSDSDAGSEPDSSGASGSESDFDPGSDAGSSSGSGAESDADSDSGSSSDSGSDGESGSDSASESEPVPQPDSDSGSSSDGVSGPDSDSGDASGSGGGSGSKPAPVPDSSSNPDSGGDSKADSGNDSGSGVSPEQGSGSGSQSDASSGSGSGSQSDSGSESGGASDSKPSDDRSPSDAAAALISLAAGKISLVGAPFVYMGKAVTPGVVVSCDDKTLIEGVDYTLTYSGNDGFGSGKVTVVAMGDYSGTLTADFAIVSNASKAFSDAPEGEWYVESGALDYAYAHNLISGYAGTDKVGAYDFIKRQDVAVILWRMAGEPQVAAGDSFEDVDYSDYYGPAVRWARASGVINGYRDADGMYRNFGPNDLVTREQLAAMIANYAEKIGGMVISSDCAKLDALPDAGSVSDWARISVGWCMDKGIMSGVRDRNTGVDYAQPAGSAWRASMASMAATLHRDVLE